MLPCTGISDLSSFFCFLTEEAILYLFLVSGLMPSPGLYITLDWRRDDTFDS